MEEDVIHLADYAQSYLLPPLLALRAVERIPEVLYLVFAVTNVSFLKIVEEH